MSSPSTPLEFVQTLAKHMHNGFYWSRTKKLKMGNIKAHLNNALLERHVSGGDPVGLAPIIPGNTTTATALLDFDSHKGETSWDEMTRIAKGVYDNAVARGLRAMPFRSSGGKGIHLLFAWENQQDCYTVRQELREVLEQSGLKAGTSGVSKGTVEVFPKQDGVEADRFGNMWVLPYAKESTALEAETFDDLGNGVPRFTYSKGLTTRQKPAIERSSLDMDAPEMSRVVSAVKALKPHDFDYDFWRTIVFALHDGTQGSEAGMELAQWFNDNICQHDKGQAHLSEQVWPYIRPADGEAQAVTVGSLFYHAAQDGWVDEAEAPNADGFEDVGEQAAAPAAKAEKAVKISYTDLASIDIDPPPEREWVVKDWLARGILHMLFSKGGKGKSLLMQMLETAVANNVDWLGLPVETTGAVLGFHCEEDDGEVRRRQHKIYAHHMLTSSEGSNGMFLNGRLGEDNLMMVFNDKRVGMVSAFYRAIEEEIKRVRPVLVVLDNIAQIFGGVENDRTHVTQFANALAGWARRYDCAVVLLGHVAKADGSEYSGSTAWENVARVRWFFKPEEDGTATLGIAKTNIGPEATLSVQWKDGVFVRVDRQKQQPESYNIAEREIVAALRQLLNEKQSASHSSRTASYLPKVMIARNMTTQREKVLGTALGRMIARGSILPDSELWRRANRAAVYGLAISPDYVDQNPLHQGDESDDLL